MLNDRLEGVCVCVNYSDFLRETLPYNMRHFDKFIVITTEADRETIGLCKHLGVECRTTDLFEKDGGFSKSRGIDYGIANLHGDGWVCHVDADIWLPPLTRHLLSHTDLDPDCIYGCDRTNCVGWEPWQQFITNHPTNASHSQHIRDCLVIPPPFPMGARISIRHYGGYVPIGFFQLWHHGKRPNRYPIHHGGAERTDVLHSLQWESSKRRLLPELIVVHLESEKGSMGTNWQGRKSAPFGPNKEGNEKHGHKKDECHQHHRHHEHHHHHHDCPPPDYC